MGSVYEKRPWLKNYPEWAPCDLKITPDTAIGDFEKLIKQNSINKKIPKMKFIGDSRKVGTILEAVRDGFKAAYKLGKFQ